MRLLLALEPPRTFLVSQLREHLDALFPGQWEIETAQEQLGCLKNTYRALGLAFSRGADFTVLAEEDCDVADDILEYFIWARGAYRADALVQAVCAHVRAGNGTDPAAVIRTSWFSPLIWGTWADRWEDLLSLNWQAAPGDSQESWDNNLRVVFRAEELYAIYPVMSRSVHRGEVSTLMSYPLAEHFYRQSVSECYRPHYEPQAYYEVPFPEEIGLLV